MICRLCLKDINDVINIFDDKGIEFNMAAVIAKYFWFEPRSDDPISTAICTCCWTSVSSFNEFYIGVEEAHRLLSERFSLKTDVELKCRKNVVRRRSPVSDKKCDEEWLLDTSISANASKHELDMADSEEEKIDVLDKTTIDCEQANSETKLPKSEKWDNDDDDGADQLSMNSEMFMEEVVVLVEESEDALAFPTEGELLSPRSSNSKNTPPKPVSSADKLSGNGANNDGQNAKAEADTTNIVAKKRRGRPPKIRIESTDTTATSKKEKTKSNKNKNEGAADDAQQEESYENRMRLIDEKIAQCIRLTCDICATEQPTFLALRKHIEQTHQCKGYATCCNKKFYKRALLYEHIEKHLNPDAYKCESCDKAFADKQCLRNHFLIKHQPEEAKQYKCEHCPKRFARPYILEQHRLIHGERKYICDVCQRGFPTENLLNTHMKTLHSGYGATMCDICAKVIIGRTAFTRHQLEHQGVVLPKVQCDKCGSWHKDKYSLQKHKRRHNEEGTLQICGICGKVAPNRSALLSHQRYVHKSARVFECGVCKKAFKKAINLKEHMAMHTGEVLYSCPHCPKTFNSNANMHSHRKKMHPKEFEETRKMRRENAAKPDWNCVTQATRNNQAKSTISDQNQIQVVNMNSSDDDNDNSKEQVIILKSADGTETHNILVTTEGFSDNDDDGDGDEDMTENSIVFTIN